MTLGKPSTYQELVTEIRRYDRDQLLLALAHHSRSWDGSTHLPDGRPHSFLPWNVAGAAATALQRGTSGGRTPDADDVSWVCYLYFNLEHPGDTADPGFALRLLARILYQQWPYQRASMLEWVRPVALFEGTSFKPDYQPKIMTPGWADRILGCSVSEWVSVGFALYAALKNGSHYPFDWEPELDVMLAALGGRERFEQIVERNFTTDAATFKTQRRAFVEAYEGTPFAQYQREPYAFNPLHNRPLVAGIRDGYWIAPSVPAIELRTSALGVIYEGIAYGGEDFSQDTGQLFEQYVGRHLALLDGPLVSPEITYRVGKDELKSVDWIVVFPSVVLLIECKGMIPRREIHEGLDAFEDAHGRLDKPIKQINRTAQAIRDRVPEFARIPADRPMVGLAVTLGNFDLANEPLLRAGLPMAEVPTAFVGIDTIERLVTAPVEELEATMLYAAAHTADGISEPAGWPATTGNGNPIMEAAFAGLPSVALVGRRQEL